MEIMHAERKKKLQMAESEMYSTPKSKNISVIIIHLNPWSQIFVLVSTFFLTTSSKNCKITSLPLNNYLVTAMKTTKNKQKCGQNQP